MLDWSVLDCLSILCWIICLGLYSSAVVWSISISWQNPGSLFWFESSICSTLRTYFYRSDAFCSCLYGRSDRNEPEVVKTQHQLAVWWSRRLYSRSLQNLAPHTRAVKNDKCILDFQIPFKKFLWSIKCKKKTQHFFCIFSVFFFLVILGQLLTQDHI